MASTTKTQRIAIWVIAIVLTAGTLGSFFMIILSNDNNANDQTALQEQYEQYLEQQKQAAQARADSSEPLDGYAANTFNASDVTELQVSVLKEGDGKTVTSDDTVKVSYFGWLDDGTIFDSSNQEGADDAPISFPLSGVIQGWTKGLDGQKVGSVVQLTIPADEAYGATGSGIIPGNAPLRFIVQIHAIETEEA